jgi:hypothetical protein
MKNAFPIAILIVLCFSLLCISAPVQAEKSIPTSTYIVDRNDDATGLPCTVAADDCSLRSAIYLANNDSANSNIRFASNMDITLTSSITLGSLVLSESNTLVEAAVGQIVKINGNSANNVFEITGSGIALRNLRIYGSGDGWSNVWINNPASEVILDQNVIGDDDPVDDGCGLSPGSYSGVFISTTSVLTPGTHHAYLYSNIIECNKGGTFWPGNGVDLISTSEVIMGLTPAKNGEKILVGNIIRYNKNDGIYVDQSYNNEFYYTYSIENGFHGMVLTNGSFNNLVQNSHFIENGGSGILVTGSASLYNSFRSPGLEAYGNAGLGIDLGGDGFTPNDPGDTDVGPNDLLNYPTLVSFSGTVVNGKSAPNGNVVICVPIGNTTKPGGGGSCYDSVASDVSGDWTYDTLGLPGDYQGMSPAALTYLAIDSTGNTSEFSPLQQIFIPFVNKP